MTQPNPTDDNCGEADLEKDLISAFERVTARDYPNPNRVGCPSSDQLRQIATPGSKMTADIIDHLGKCWPCVQDLKQLRRTK